ncbi:FadR/GntR family transcriptional regulator [Embleya scabrispora]|uniref:FadR/GntR family transcriptional regulator n=1 Tax=Embleya scabrispora TaxID=159449 RepID=UPI00037E4F3A|nr:FadR/GntR family transcriptional regulator [Embleya scabrispora]MYS80362.1 FCD domain-containing protein [Streptomyces sp. SID5474]
MTVTDAAIENIKEMIVSGALRPGDRLPKEADLATELGVSRSSLRKAVRALSLLNILDVRQGDGTYIGSLEPHLLLEAVTFVLDFHRDDTVMPALRVRAILEPAATALAAQRIDDAELAELQALLDRAGDSPSAEELVTADLEFHHRIAAASGIPLLCTLSESVSRLTVRTRVRLGFTERDAVAYTLAEHRAIAAALADRDPDTARAWATAHIAGLTHRLSAAL